MLLVPLTHTQDSFSTSYRHTHGQLAWFFHGENMQTPSLGMAVLFNWSEENRSTRSEPTRIRGEHANSDSPGTSCCGATAVTTKASDDVIDDDVTDGSGSHHDRL